MRRIVEWAILIAVSAALGALLTKVRLPAALLLGPVAAAAAMAAVGARPSVPQFAFRAAQAVIGCMMARGLTGPVFGEIAHDWPLFAGSVISVIAASCVLGSSMARLRVLPGSTAVWGSMPGAATAMIVMADAYGADARLVAFMQYLRVLMVAVAATMVARIWAPGPAGGPSHDAAWLAPVDWRSFASTLLIVLACAGSTRFLRMPAGSLLLPLALCSVLQAAGLLKIELPAGLLVASYAVIGWSVGSRFTRDILSYAARVLPQIACSIGILIASCALIGSALVLFARIDPFTAYLATSPGGADTVAIIAASSKVNVPFVMAVQSARVLVVILIGPPLARWIGGKTADRSE